MPSFQIFRLLVPPSHSGCNKTQFYILDLHIWSNFHRCWTHWAQGIGPRSPKNDYVHTIYRLVYEIPLVWCLQATQAVTKVSFIFLIYILGPLFIHVGPIVPKIKGQEAQEMTTLRPFFNQSMDFQAFGAPQPLKPQHKNQLQILVFLVQFSYTWDPQSPRYRVPRAQKLVPDKNGKNAQKALKDVKMQEKGYSGRTPMKWPQDSPTLKAQIPDENSKQGPEIACGVTIYTLL